MIRGLLLLTLGSAVVLTLISVDRVQAQYPIVLGSLTATISNPLPPPNTTLSVVCVLRDARGAVIPQQPVSFSVTPGGSISGSPVVLTDSSGTAVATVRAGVVPGTFEVSCESMQLAADVIAEVTPPEDRPAPPSRDLPRPPDSIVPPRTGDGGLRK